jgi:hypothetical protein
VTTRARPTLPALRRLPLSALGAAGLVLLALLAASGDLTQAPIQVSAYWVDSALIVAGGVALAGLVITRRQGAGALSLGLFGALAVLTALSIAWSVAPDQSWEESGRTAAYLAAFAVALVAARRGTGDSRGAVITITLAATALCVWALAVKVLSLNLYGQPSYGRLVAPSGYWNATGLAGALALPGLIWLAARRHAPAAAGLALAGIAVAVSVVALSYSRSAVLAALLGTVIPLAFLHARRRAVVMLMLGLLGALPICLYALFDTTISSDLSDSLYGDGPTQLNRTGAGLVLGAIILAVAVLLTVGGAAFSRRLDAQPQPVARLAWLDRGLLALVGAVPVAVILWLSLNHRGPTGEISHLWHSLTANNPDTGDQANRLETLANSRSAYWRQALSIGRHHLLAGAGADSFYPALQRYRDAFLTPPGNIAHHAHSYVLDTFASFGLLGVALNLGLFSAWCRDGARAVRTRARGTGAGSHRPGAPITAVELDARWALIGGVIAFGASSAIDYTWSFPAVAVPALLAAGWIAGVGPAARSTPVQLASAGPPRPAEAPPAPLSARPGAILALTALAVVTLAVAWESLQPMRSIQSAAASTSAQTAADVAIEHDDALTARVDAGIALGDARAAVSEDPLSVTARVRLATVYQALGQSPAARAQLVRATQVQPENPQSFYWLGVYLLKHGDDVAATVPLKRATVLDITDSLCQTQALAAAQARRPAPTTCERAG